MEFRQNLPIVLSDAIPVHSIGNLSKFGISIWRTGATQRKV